MPSRFRQAIPSQAAIEAEIKRINERAPVTTAEELATFDPEEMVEGYRDGFAGDKEPGDNRSKAYWHGWRNGRTDRGDAPVDAAQIALVCDVVGTRK